MTATAKPGATRAAKAAEALPPAAPSLLLAPVLPGPGCPQGRAGAVLIHGASYLLSYHAEAGKVTGYRVVSPAGKAYDLPRNLQDCDCGDCNFRKRACKHITSLAQLRQEGKIL